MLRDVAPGRDAMGVNVEYAVTDLRQLGMAQARFFLNLAFGGGQGRWIALLAMPARLQPAGQLLMPNEQGERVGWVDDEGGSGDVALERIPAEGRRLGSHKCRNGRQVAGFGFVGGRVGTERIA
jgi:hypothetical protein